MSSRLSREVLWGAAAGLLLAWLLRRRPRRPAAARPAAAARAQAVITGASSGIGAVFARRLAAQGYDVVLCARREERLRALAAELSARYDIAADVLVADLANAADVERAAQAIADLPELEILVNNAGFGLEGRFARAAADDELRMVDVHMRAPVRFSRAALPGMLARGRGAIINVSSVAAFFSLPGSILYGSTKSFLNAFSRGLQSEIDAMGGRAGGSCVRVQALCPGFTHSEFHDPLARFDRGRIPEFLWLQAGDVVAESLDTLWDGPVVCVPSRRYRLVVRLAQLPIIDPLLRIGTRLLFPGRIRGD